MILFISVAFIRNVSTYQLSSIYIPVARRLANFKQELLNDGQWSSFHFLISVNCLYNVLFIVLYRYTILYMKHLTNIYQAFDHEYGTILSASL